MRSILIMPHITQIKSRTMLLYFISFVYLHLFLQLLVIYTKVTFSPLFSNWIITTTEWKGWAGSITNTKRIKKTLNFKLSYLKIILTQDINKKTITYETLNLCIFCAVYSNVMTSISNSFSKLCSYWTWLCNTV